MKVFVTALLTAGALAVPGAALGPAKAAAGGACATATASLAQQPNAKQNRYPTWWAKYQYLLANPAGRSSVGPTGAGSPQTVGSNVDVSNECGPQSEPSLTLTPLPPQTRAGGSNEISRLPMRGSASSDDGSPWRGVALPLPAALGTNGIDFGSDPTLAYDTRGNVFYGYIVV